MISIRRLQIGEGELFKQMRLTSLREAPYAFSSTYESALRRSPESWSEQANSTAQGSDRATFIAFSGNSQIGIAALYRNPEGTDAGEVFQVWVAPEYRSKEVAFDLLDAVFQWAGENGFQIITATIMKGNTRALKFYQKYGFDLADGASSDSPDDLVLIKEVQAQRGGEATTRREACES
jgi:ribosomal protein S18 acetylase RimI-like enzyme